MNINFNSLSNKVNQISFFSFSDIEIDSRFQNISNLVQETINSKEISLEKKRELLNQYKSKIVDIKNETLVGQLFYRFYPDAKKRHDRILVTSNEFISKLEKQLDRQEIATKIKELSFHAKEKPDQEKAMAVAALIKKNRRAEPNSATISLKPFTRQPLENLEKMKGLTLPDQKFAKLIPYEKFRSALRNTFAETLQTILRSPENEREYVIIADSEYKSTNWAASHVLDLMSIHPPSAIVRREMLGGYLSNHPTIKHVVMIDDASYSGKQASSYIFHYEGTKDKVFHINIPYMTSYAKGKIKKALIDKNFDKFFFPKGQLLLSYKELDDAGFFGYTKMMRPDVQKLLEMDSLKMVEGLNDESIKTVEEWDNQFQKLKKTVFKGPKGWKTSIEIDNYNIARLNQLIESLLSIKTLIQNSQEILEKLNSVKDGVERFGTDEKKRDKEKTAYLKKGGDSTRQTPTWMAHKKADGTSTNVLSMRKAVISQEDNIEPYKDDDIRWQVREKYIKILQMEFPEIVKQWQSSIISANLFPLDINIIQSNRGLFLLGNNYIKDLKDAPTKTYIITQDQKKIPFGGSDGDFQFKIEEGVPFTIQISFRWGWREKQAQFVYKDGNFKHLEIGI